MMIIIKIIMARNMAKTSLRAKYEVGMMRMKRNMAMAKNDPKYIMYLFADLGRF